MAITLDGTDGVTTTGLTSNGIDDNATSTAVTIDSDGIVMVGKTSKSVVSNGVEFRGEGILATSRDDAPTFYMNRTTTTGEICRIYQDSNKVGGITVTTSSTAYNTSSDYRLKENVVDLDNATDRLKQIPVHRFNFIADADTTVDGFLAHEVQAVVPEAITGVKDEVDDEGNPVYQGIDQSKLVPLLVATVKELEARIATLEAN